MARPGGHDGCTPEGGGKSGDFLGAGTCADVRGQGSAALRPAGLRIRDRWADHHGICPNTTPITSMDSDTSAARHRTFL
jgi:hypothetical protein